MIEIFLFFWYMVLPIVACILLILFVVVVYVYKRKIPEPARKLWAAVRKGLLPMVLVHDSGRSVLLLFKERKGEGVMIDEAERRYRILPRYIGEIEEDDTEETEGNPEPKPKKKKRIIKSYSDIITKRSILSGLGMPFLIGYSGTLCAASPECLAAIEAGEMYVETADQPLMSKKGEKKKADLEAKGEDWRKAMMQPILLLDPRKFKEVLDESYDESQLGACMLDSERIGNLGRPSALTKALPFLAIAVVIVVVIIGVLVVPDMIGGFT